MAQDVHTPAEVAPARNAPRLRDSRYGSWMAAPAVVLSVGLFMTPPPAYAAEGPDTIGVRVEFGATSDLTNELYYEDAFIDTTFLGRQQVSSPETRVAGVLFTGVQGTRNTRRARFSLQNELRLGDKLQRDALSMLWIDDPSPGWRWSVQPLVEYRKDQTFDRDLEEWRGSVSSRIRRALDDDNTFADVRAKGEFLRTKGDGADFIPDRNAVQIAASLDHSPLFGQEWRFGYRLDARGFPDSTVRDHFEHGLEGRLKFALPAGSWLAFDGTASRRATMREAPTSRDNFWSEWAQSELALRISDVWSIRSRVELEGFQYDLEDTSIYFNYAVARARIGPRYEQLVGWSLGAGPMGESLRSRLDPEEDYDEIGGFLEVEFLGAGGWWNLTPAAGWREYGSSGNDVDGLDLHSSYAFYEIGVLGDQRIPGGLRFRAVASARTDVHSDSVNNATSLYFSLDVRRLF
jgi:hypothetical protein